MKTTAMEVDCGATSQESEPQAPPSPMQTDEQPCCSSSLLPPPAEPRPETPPPVLAPELRSETAESCRPPPATTSGARRSKLADVTALSEEEEKPALDPFEMAARRERRLEMQDLVRRRRAGKLTLSAYHLQIEQMDSVDDEEGEFDRITEDEYRRREGGSSS